MSYTEEQLAEAFRDFDTDNSGFINKSELVSLLEKMNVDDAATIAKNIIGDTDTDKDGKLSYEEFKAAMA